MLKPIYLFIILLISTTGCISQENTSKKTFDKTTLLNKIEFVNPKDDQPKFCCAFLLKYKNDTIAVTAKHVLNHIKPSNIKIQDLEKNIKSWSMFPLDAKTETVVCDKLLNQKADLLEAKSTYENDWLVFSVKQNSSKVKPLEMRASPLVEGEKLYVVGWTRTMESDPQRVYEFEYYKTIGNRILLKDIFIPEKFGGLSGAPVLDENGLVVAIVSNATLDPVTNKKYFSPCLLNSITELLN